MTQPSATTDAARSPLAGERARILRRFIALHRETVLGVMAASVAHAINTPLMQVYGGVTEGRERARRLRRELRACVERGDADALLEQVAALASALDHVHHDLRHVAIASRNIGLFAAARSPAPSVALPTELLQLCLDLMENEIRHRARFASEMCELPSLRGSEEALGHLFIAALTASLHAVPEGGAANHTIAVRARAEPQWVTVDFEDTGGERHLPVDDEEVFVALLGARSQTQVALAVCRARVGELAGEVELLRLARGYRLRLRLPTTPPTDERAPAGGEADDAAKEPPRRGRVLVIDDEPNLLSLVCQILRLDHEVEGTTDPREALGRLEAGERYDLILCDLMMPDMSGTELYLAVQRFAPHVAARMVFLTAGALGERAQAFLQRGGVSWLSKPLEPEVLRAEVRARVSAAR